MFVNIVKTLQCHNRQILPNPNHYYFLLGTLGNVSEALVVSFAT